MQKVSSNKQKVTRNEYKVSSNEEKQQAMSKNFVEKTNAVFGKNIENVSKHRNIKLLKTERRRDYLVSEPNYCTSKFFTDRKFISYRNGKNTNTK